MWKNKYMREDKRVGETEYMCVYERECVWAEGGGGVKCVRDEETEHISESERARERERVGAE